MPPAPTSAKLLISAATSLVSILASGSLEDLQNQRLNEFHDLSFLKVSDPPISELRTNNVTRIREGALKRYESRRQ